MRTLWIATAVLAAAALIVGAYRLYAPAAPHPEVEEMLTLLEVDPRVRLEGTRAAVTTVAQRVLSGEWETPEAVYGLGLHYHYLVETPGPAEESYRRTIGMRPEWSWPHNSLGILLYTQGRRDEAEVAFREAMRLDPQWSRPHSDLAILYRLEGRVDQAEQEARRALELDPQGAATNNNYGVILDMLDNEAGAERYYRRAIAIAPEIPSPYYNLASLHARRDKLDDAIGLLEKAIQLDNGFREELAKDPDFAAVLNDPRVQELLKPEPPAPR
jgi:Flp pilus assembly protein TadD